MNRATEPSGLQKPLVGFHPTDLALAKWRSEQGLCLEASGEELNEPLSIADNGIPLWLYKSDTYPRHWNTQCELHPTLYRRPLVKYYIVIMINDSDIASIAEVAPLPAFCQAFTVKTQIICSRLNVKVWGVFWVLNLVLSRGGQSICILYLSKITDTNVNKYSGERKSTDSTYLLE